MRVRVAAAGAGTGVPGRPGELDRILAQGAERARGVAASTLATVYDEDRLPATRELSGLEEHPTVTGLIDHRTGLQSDRAASERVAAEVAANGRSDGDAKPSKLEQLRARYGWLDHLVRAGARYTDHHGDHYAAAITFFSILSLVPLLMIAFAVGRLRAVLQPESAERDPRRDRRRPCRPEHGRTPSTRSSTRPSPSGTRWPRSACSPRCTPGIGWMTNLREALSEQWAQSPGAAGLAEAAAVRPHRALRPRDRAGGLLRDHRRGVRIRRGRAGLRRAGGPGLGAGAAAAARRSCSASPRTSWCSCG